MLADEAAGCRERIVLADQAYSIRVPSVPDQRDITRDIHTGGTQGYTGYRLVVCTDTSSSLNMFNVVVPVSDQSLIHHIGSLITDRAVCGLHNGHGCLLHNIQGFHGCFPVKDILDQVVKLAKPDSARHTFAAGLCMT